MSVPTLERQNSAAHPLQCGRKIVAVLFRTTGLAAIVRRNPAVIVDSGNWISASNALEDTTKNNLVQSATRLVYKDESGYPPAFRPHTTLRVRRSQ